MGDEKVEVINIKNVLEIIYKNILVILLITVIFASISFIVSKVFLHRNIGHLYRFMLWITK